MMPVMAQHREPQRKARARADMFTVEKEKQGLGPRLGARVRLKLN